MKIVIEIPDECYEELNNGRFPVQDAYRLVAWIKNGTPLQKGHGRLIDANRLRSMYSINRANFNTVVGIQKWIDDAPTIIEADRSEE